jgi:hypothetical protein
VRRNVTEEGLGELARAATSVGRQIGSQRGRPIFAFLFRKELFVVAVEIGTNGYIVSMNLKSRSLLEEAGLTEEDILNWE